MGFYRAAVITVVVAVVAGGSSCHAFLPQRNSGAALAHHYPSNNSNNNHRRDFRLLQQQQEPKVEQQQEQEDWISQGFEKEGPVTADLDQLLAKMDSVKDWQATVHRLQQANEEKDQEIKLLKEQLAASGQERQEKQQQQRVVEELQDQLAEAQVLRAEDQQAFRVVESALLSAQLEDDVDFQEELSKLQKELVQTKTELEATRIKKDALEQSHNRTVRALERKGSKTRKTPQLPDQDHLETELEQALVQQLQEQLTTADTKLLDQQLAFDQQLMSLEAQHISELEEARMVHAQALEEMKASLGAQHDEAMEDLRKSHRTEQQERAVQRQRSTVAEKALAQERQETAAQWQLLNDKLMALTTSHEAELQLVQKAHDEELDKVKAYVVAAMSGGAKKSLERFEQELPASADALQQLHQRQVASMRAHYEADISMLRRSYEIGELQAQQQKLLVAGNPVASSSSCSDTERQERLARLAEQAKEKVSKYATEIEAIRSRKNMSMPQRHQQPGDTTTGAFLAVALGLVLLAVDADSLPQTVWPWMDNFSLDPSGMLDQLSALTQTVESVLYYKTFQLEVPTSFHNIEELKETVNSILDQVGGMKETALSNALHLDSVMVDLSTMVVSKLEGMKDSVFEQSSPMQRAVILDSVRDWMSHAPASVDELHETVKAAKL